MMAWLCTRDETFDGSQMCIVTGPNIDMATKLIRRAKDIFEPKLGLTFSNKETILELNGYIVMVSTPNNPGGLFYNIEKEPEDSCLYKRLKMDYNYGLGRIYTVEEIEKAKQSPGFDREYGLQYLGKSRNIFNPLQIDKTIQLGEQYKGL